MKVLITGASGLMGEDIADVFKEKHKVIPLRGRESIGITNNARIYSYIRNKKPNPVIHCAA